MTQITPQKTSHTRLLELAKDQSDVVYVPNYGNLGDALIAHATYRFLHRHGLKFRIMRPTKNVEGACVLGGGGGNLIEGKYTDLATFIQRCGSKNRLIVLPHNILGNSDLFRSVADRVHIFAREVPTYRFLTSIGIPLDRLFLADDMAFSLAGELAPTMHRRRASPDIGGPLRCATRACGRYAIHGPTSQLRIIPPNVLSPADPRAARHSLQRLRKRRIASQPPG